MNNRIPVAADTNTEYYGDLFERDVDAAMASARTMSQEEYEEGSWRDLPIGHICPTYSGAAGTVVVGIEPSVARRLRDGYRGSSRLHFVILQNGEFAVLVEPAVAEYAISASHYASFDFPGGRRVVYAKD